MAAKNQPTADAVTSGAPVATGTAGDATRAPAAAEAVVSTDLAVDAPALEEAATGVPDPAPATALEQPSGAIIEPAIVDAVDVAHEAIDANPRAGTTAVQNAIDLNDAKRANPVDPDFAGQGIDLSVYGTPGSADDAAVAPADTTARKA